MWCVPPMFGGLLSWFENPNSLTPCGASHSDDVRLSFFNEFSWGEPESSNSRGQAVGFFRVFCWSSILVDGSWWLVV